jgi:putative transport protein
LEFARTILEQQPLVALFLTIAIGYLIGEVSIKGFSLGVGAVLFVALAIGWFAPRCAPAAILGNFGLALFLYAVGIHYGPQFFAGFTSARGLQANLLAFIGVLTAGGLSLLFVLWAGLDLGYALGLFAGSGTSTPTLQAAITALDNDNPAVGYSIAYPFGVAGPILFLYLTFAWLKPKVEQPLGGGMELLEISLQNSEYFGQRLGDILGVLPADARIIAVRRNQQNRPADTNTVLAENDVLLVVAPHQSQLEEVRQRFGEAAPGMFTQDRRDLDYLRVFASRPMVVGMVLGDLKLPGDWPSVVAHVRRGDTELQPRPDLVLEFGDRVGLLAHRADFPALRRFFGDSIKGTAEFSYLSIGLGMALGLILGAIPLPLPGVATIQLGLSGVLIVALILGRQRRTARLNWTLPISANLVLRNLGLTIFLAQVGMAAGPKFASAIAETGLVLLGMGAIVLVGLILPILLLGLFVFRMPYDELAGIVSGACGNAAILAFANKQVPNDRPDIGYAMIFPGMTIVKILFVSIVPAFL